MRAITNTHAATDGPNCLNAVRLWHQLARGPRLDDWRTLDRQLRDGGRFRELATNERPRMGDVILIRYTPTSNIEHAAIHLSPTHVWEKESGNQRDPYRITTHEVSLREYASRLATGHLVIQRFRRVDAQ